MEIEKKQKMLKNKERSERGKENDIVFIINIIINIIIIIFYR